MFPNILVFALILYPIFGDKVIGIENNENGIQCLTEAPDYVSSWIFWGLLTQKQEPRRAADGRLCIVKNGPCGNGALVSTLQIIIPSDNSMRYEDIECEELKNEGLHASGIIMGLLLVGVPITITVIAIILIFSFLCCCRFYNWIKRPWYTYERLPQYDI